MLGKLGCHHTCFLHLDTLLAPGLSKVCSSLLWQTRERGGDSAVYKVSHAQDDRSWLIFLKDPKKHKMTFYSWERHYLVAEPHLLVEKHSLVKQDAQDTVTHHLTPLHTCTYTTSQGAHSPEIILHILLISNVFSKS